MDEFKQTIMEILHSDRYMGIEDCKEQKAHAIFIAHKVMRDLYEILIDEEETDLPWDEFLEYIASKSGIIHLAGKVVMATILGYPSTSRFNFKNPGLSALAELEEYETLKGYSLFSDKEAFALVEYHFLMAEIAYFFRLRVQRGYTWEQYTKELGRNGDTWNTLLFAFRESILQMDFKSEWRKLGSAELFDDPVPDM